ncbi:hypothetical protein GF415_00235 [Candidatus Micrarchaeota archaeon]|nr:hypothetical protein [Candidatus Micrarchaeota archaeon]
MALRFKTPPKASRAPPPKRNQHSKPPIPKRELQNFFQGNSGRPPAHPRPKQGIQPVRPSPEAAWKLSRKRNIKKAPSASEPPAKKGSLPSSIDIAFEGETGAMIREDRELAHMGASLLFQELANLCIKLNPSLEEEVFLFDMEGISCGRTQIGDFEGKKGEVTAKIPLSCLGYSIETPPLSAINRLFDVSVKKMGGDISQALSESKSIELIGKLLGTRHAVRLCFLDTSGKILFSAPERE